ncbi:MAG: hypothetical protein E6J91_17280 [Deltaproteobacteria bacterium]|nr:MAG: hypothetical protein E6J91_17280 [Deltaproteobacteria bacterium]
MLADADLGLEGAGGDERVLAVDGDLGAGHAARDLDVGELAGDELEVLLGVVELVLAERILAVLDREVELIEHFDRLVEVDQREREVVVDRGVVPALERVAVARDGLREQAVVEQVVALMERGLRAVLADPGHRLGAAEGLVGAGLLVGLHRRGLGRPGFSGVGRRGAGRARSGRLGRGRSGRSL